MLPSGTHQRVSAHRGALSYGRASTAFWSASTVCTSRTDSFSGGQPRNAASRRNHPAACPVAMQTGWPRAEPAASCVAESDRPHHRKIVDRRSGTRQRAGMPYDLSIFEGPCQRCRPRTDGAGRWGGLVHVVDVERIRAARNLVVEVAACAHVLVRSARNAPGCAASRGCQPGTGSTPHSSARSPVRTCAGSGSLPASAAASRLRLASDRRDRCRRCHALA